MNVSITRRTLVYMATCEFQTTNSKLQNSLRNNIQCVPFAGSPENVGLQKEQKCNTFACHTCNEVRLRVLGIREKEFGNTKR
jgi:hypothetical protein